jgi:hypothetical protein
MGKEGFVFVFQLQLITGAPEFGMEYMETERLSAAEKRLFLTNIGSRDERAFLLSNRHRVPHSNINYN